MQENNNQGNSLRNPIQFKLWQFVLILVGFALLDTFTGVAILIGLVIFSIKGCQGLAISLCVINCVSPDSVPLIDEAFSIVVVAVPFYKQYQQSGSFIEAIKVAFKSCIAYKNKSAEYGECNNAIELAQKVIEDNQNDEYNQDDTNLYLTDENTTSKEYEEISKS